MIEPDAAIFARFPCSLGPLFLALVAYHVERGGMRLYAHEAGGSKCEKDATYRYQGAGALYRI